MTEDRSMRVLLTNDDGVYAPGLACLEKIAYTLSDDVWVAAPESEQSGASHSLSLSDPMRVRQLGEKKFAVRGTPTDCVILAVRHLIPDRAPDLVLSGVNRGHNIADDVTYSGTVAGAMEGTALGIRAIALSQAYGFDGRNKIRWDVAEHFAPRLIRRVLEKGWPKDVFLNINFPDHPIAMIKGTKMTSQGKRDQNLLCIKRREDPRCEPYYWMMYERGENSPIIGTDLWAIENGYNSVSPLHLNMTQYAVLEKLGDMLDGIGE